jgi:hypothetical protein
LTDADTDAIMADLQQRVRDRLRAERHAQASSDGFQNPEILTGVEELLRRAADVRDTDTLLLAELLGDPATWRPQLSLRYSSHRSGSQAAVIIFLKRRLLMPMFRWLFEYSRDNFERQRRVNQVLFACVQELAVETVRLRQQLRQPAPQGVRPPDADPSR